MFPNEVHCLFFYHSFGVFGNFAVVSKQNVFSSLLLHHSLGFFFMFFWVFQKQWEANAHGRLAAALILKQCTHRQLFTRWASLWSCQLVACGHFGLQLSQC